MDLASRDTISPRFQLIHHRLKLFPHRTLELGDGDELVSRGGIGVDELVSERDSWIGIVEVIVENRREGNQGLKLVGMSEGEWAGGKF